MKTPPTLHRLVLGNLPWCTLLVHVWPTDRPERLALRLRKVVAKLDRRMRRVRGDGLSRDEFMSRPQSLELARLILDQVDRDRTRPDGLHFTRCTFENPDAREV